MNPLFAKLNLKDHKTILVLNAPASFEAELEQLQGVLVVRDVSGMETVSFAIVFVQSVAEVAAAATKMRRKTPGDPVLWFAYPKGTSKRYQSEINRDTGWDAVTHAGFDTVRQVAIDDDWSALRFRRVEHVNTASPRRRRSAGHKNP